MIFKNELSNMVVLVKNENLRNIDIIIDSLAKNLYRDGKYTESIIADDRQKKQHFS